MKTQENAWEFRSTVTEDMCNFRIYVFNPWYCFYVTLPARKILEWHLHGSMYAMMMFQIIWPFIFESQVQICISYMVWGELSNWKNSFIAFIIKRMHEMHSLVHEAPWPPYPRWYLMLVSIPGSISSKFVASASFLGCQLWACGCCREAMWQ